MCSVCVAETALYAVAEHKVANGKTIQMIAIGNKAENSPAKFQLKYSNKGWTDKWHRTNDLAGTVEELNLDRHEDTTTKEHRKNRAKYLSAKTN